jgi:class 3 adenylate cyclase
VQGGGQSDRPERRSATVLFCDLGGYTAWNEQEEPEEVAAVMDRIKQQAARIFESFGGLANQFVGDEVVGLFGIGQSHEDDPQRAVAAALALHAFVREQLELRGPSAARALRMHSGIETGVLFVRARDPRSGLWDITGDTVNLAARLRSLAEPDEILIGPGTHACVAPFYASEALPEQSVRGRRKPVVAHRVLAAAAASRFDVSERRGLTRYVGRERDLAQLQLAWQRAEAGQGALVAIEGPAGIGKTRLLHELRRALASAGEAAPRILHGHCHDSGNVPPYQPFVDALRGLSLQECALSEQARDALAYLLAPGQLPARFGEASGEQLRDALAAALCELCFALARERPLLIVFEDWHVADEPSRTALRHLAQGLDHCRALIAVNCRPGEVAGTLRALSALHLELAPLDEAATASVARGVLDAAELPAGLSAYIYERAQGNPFFAEEVARSLLESGALIRLGGALRLVAPVAQLQTPHTVQAIVRARVDRLPRAQRELLSVASVIGVQFSVELLERLLTLQRAAQPGAEPQPTRPLLAALEQQGLLYHSSSTLDDYQFRHAITQEVVYQSLPLYERRALHELVARSTEAASAGEPPCEVLAHHYARSMNRAKALHYTQLAGDKAWRAFSLQQADLHYRRALELIDGSDAPELARQRLQLAARWARVGVYNPHPDQVTALRTSRTSAESAGDARGACLCLNWLSWLEYALGRQPAALACSLEFLAAARALDDPLFTAQALTNAGLCHAMATEYREAVGYFEAGIAARGRFTGTAYAYALGSLAMLHGDQGDFARALDLAQRAVTIADQSGRLTLQGPALTQRGMVEAWSGAFEACANTGAAVHDIAEHIDGNYLRAMGRSLEGYARFMLTRDASAIDLQREAVTLLERHAIGLHASWTLSLLAETLLLTGQLEEAERAAESALRRAQENDRLGECAALRVCMQLAAARGQASQAAERFHARALAVADAKGSQREHALTQLCFVPLLRALGEPERADALTAAARSALVALGHRSADSLPD